jgi:Pyridoxamine 5'-phosphate oxidase
MSKTFDEITEHHRAWIAGQCMFFVATAPLGADGHVNVSPKSPVGSLRILGPRRVAYLDVGGSGAETIAHVRENGRIVVMFCAFQGPPRILRLHGRGTVVVRDEPGFEELLAEGGFEDASLPEARRAIVVVDVTRVSDSCGYTVPIMSFDGAREHHQLSTAKRLRTAGQEAYWRHRLEANATSIDGLPALGDRRRAGEAAGSARA